MTSISEMEKELGAAAEADVLRTAMRNAENARFPMHDETTSARIAEVQERLERDEMLAKKLARDRDQEVLTLRRKKVALRQRFEQLSSDLDQKIAATTEKWDRQVQATYRSIEAHEASLAVLQRAPVERDGAVERRAPRCV